MCKAPEVQEARSEAVLGSQGFSSQVKSWWAREKFLGDQSMTLFVCVCDHLNCKPLTVGNLISLLRSQSIYHHTQQKWVLSWHFQDVKKHWKKLQTRILVHLGLYWFSLGLWPHHTIDVQVLLDQQNHRKDFIFYIFLSSKNCLFILSTLSAK